MFTNKTKIQNLVIGVLGPSGCGKSTLAKFLADQFEIPFLEADDFHSDANILKMKNGIALKDEDRLPWLKNLGDALNQNTPSVFSCSALKELYRSIILERLQIETQCLWIVPEFDQKLLFDRLQKRKNHFFNPSLLEDQLNTYEEPQQSEDSRSHLYFCTSQDLDFIMHKVAEICNSLGERTTD